MVDAFVARQAEVPGLVEGEVKLRSAGFCADDVEMKGYQSVGDLE